MPYTQEEKRILGKKGEEFVKYFLNNCRRPIKFSYDEFDQVKDASFVENEKTVEVKTQQAFVKKNAFTFAENQLEKCKSVDELYIVSIPPKIKSDYIYGGKIFRVIPTHFEHYRYNIKTKSMIAIPIEQPFVLQVYNMNDAERKYFSSLSKSQY